MTSSPVTADSSVAVSAARCRSEETMASGLRAASSRAARCACDRPASVSGMSVLPWKRPSRFQEVWPCRQKTTRLP